MFFEINIVGYVNQKKQKVIEGELRCAELREYLDYIKAIKHVFLSEDATSIVSKIQYDPKSNQLVGIVLPIDGKSGMPISFSFKASSATAIQNIIKAEEQSISVYIVMAQPLIKNAPPFVLQIFGTNNKFTAPNVMKRWQHTIQELKK